MPRRRRSIIVAQFFHPANLAAFYPLRGSELPVWHVAAAAFVLAAISVAALIGGRRYPYLLVGWLWYLGMLVPVIGLVQVGGQADGRSVHVFAADRAVHRVDVVGRLAGGFGSMAPASPAVWRHRRGDSCLA